MYVCATHICLVPTKSKEGTRSYGTDRTGVTDGWKPPYGYWKLNPGSSERPTIFLSPELSFQTPGLRFNNP